MLFTGNLENRDEKLIIFEHFIEDGNLKNKNITVGLAQDDSYDDFDDGGPLFINGPMSHATIRTRSGKIDMSRRGILYRIYSYIKKVFIELFIEEDVKKVMMRIKSSVEEITTFNERESNLLLAKERAKYLGQKDLAKRLESEYEISSMENLLFSKGFKTYLSERQILEFSKKCERGLCLDWISDFVRLIPKEVYEKKVSADVLNVFDNYVVLHYDPQNRSTIEATRNKQEEKIKDPIMFGVIKGSRRLYFIADWIDEKCDLTLEQVIKTINEQPLDL